MGDIVITPASNDVNSTAGTLVLRSSDLNPISLRTNNTNRLFIDPTGSVGLGTAVPTGGLHINYAPGAFSEALRLQRNGGVFYSFGLDTNFLNIAYNGNVNANNVLVLTSNGYLGVGNLQNALFNLDVASASAKGIQLRFDATTGYRAQITPYWNTNTDTRIDFAINRAANVVADVIMSVGYDNNVGIGTVQPSQKLDVRGNIKLGADNAGNYVYYVKDNEGTIIRTTRSDVTQQGLFRSDGWGNFTADKSIGIGYSLGSNFASSTIGNGNLYVANTVGINTTSPTSKLNVVETTAIGTRIQLGTNSENALMDANKTVDMLILNAPYGTNSATTSNAGAKWGIKFVGSLEAGQINTTGKTSAIYAVSEDSLGYNRGTSLAFYTNQLTDIPYSEKMRIYHNGNIGIGITNPTNKVHISGGGISFTTSTGLAVQMIGIVLPTNIGYIGPYNSPADGNSPTVVALNHAASVQQTWFYSSGRIAMSLNREGRFHIGNLNNAPNCLLSVGPTSTTTAVSGMCFGNDASANLYRSAASTITTDGSLTVVGGASFGGNVGIGTTAPSSLLDVIGTVRFNSLGAAETRNVVNQAGQRISMPSGGAKFLGNSATGAIRIKSPVNGSSDSMHTIKGTVFEYTTGKSFQFLVSFYYYSNTAQQVTAQIIGGSNAALNRNFTVRIGRDANSAFLIYIGELADSWNYAYVYITELFFGWSMDQSNLNNYQTGWTISTEGSAFENVMATVADTQITNWSRNGSSTYYTLGNVGIGTTNPTQKLDIVGSYGAPDDNAGILKIRGTGVGPTQLNFGVSADGGYGWIQATDIAVDNDRDIILGPLGGDIGIGITNPGAKLQVYASAAVNNSKLFMAGDNANNLNYVPSTTAGGWNSASVLGGSALFNSLGSTWLIGTHNGPAMRFGTNNISLTNPLGGIDLYVGSGANIGISNTTPKFALHVNGDVTIPNARYLNFNPGELQGTAMTRALTVSYSDDTATSQPKQLGIILHNNSNTNDTFSPALVFGSKSNSSNYSQATAVIAGRRRSLVGDVNWHAGELWFWTATSNDAGGLVGVGIPTATPAMVINSTRFVGIGASSPGDKLQVNLNSGENILANIIGNGVSVNNKVSFRLSELGTPVAEFSLVRDGTSYQTKLQTVTTSPLSFGTSGTTKMVIDTVGYVGIGITNPTARLQVVQSNAGGVAAILLSSDESTIQGPSANTQIRMGSNLVLNGSNILTLGTNNVTRMVIDVTGNVGIGTVAPTAQNNYKFLQVNGQNSAIIEAMVNNVRIGGIDSDSSRLYFGSIGSYPIVFRTAVVEKMRITAAGLVGIGTATPNTLLSVGGAGSISAASGITLGGDASANLYRDSTARVRTDGAFISSSYIYAGTYLQTSNGNIFPANFSTDIVLNVGNAAANSWETYPFTLKKGGYVGLGTNSPSGKLHIVSTVAGETVLRTDGTNGTLFSVVDDLSDSLMSVNNSAGLPVLEVFADDRIVMGQYGSGDLTVRNNKVGIGATNPAFKLDVNGSFGVNAGTNDENWPFIVVDPNTAGNANRYALNKIGAMGFNNANNYAQLQLVGANGAYIDFCNAAIDDLDARIIYYSNDRFDFVYGTTMTVKSAGVGIDTTNPAFKLDVAGTARAERYRGINSLVLNTYATVNPASNVFLYSQGNDRDSWLYLDSADTASNWGIYHRQIDTTVSNLPGNSIGFIGGGANTLQAYISLANGAAYFAGNVGIGSVSPSSKLDVYGGTLTVATKSSYALAVGNANTDLTFGANASNAYIQSWSSKPLYINNQGNNTIIGADVGIGNATPVGARLHIKGDTLNPVLRVEDAQLVGAAGGTAGKTFVGWLPIMTGALSPADKVFIPLYK